MFAVGEAAPDFELLSDTGAAVRLSAFRGRRVILFFFPRAATPGCTTQACGLRDHFPAIEAAGATVIGVSPDAPETLAKWKVAEGLPYTLLSDPDKAVATQYNAYGEKSMYGKVYMGIIRSHFVIDAAGNFEDVQVKISPKKSIEKAVQQVTG
jgi:peroxiredoxin Q/BCP